MKNTTILNWAFGAMLVLGTGTYALADDHGSDSHGSDSSVSASSSSGQIQAGDDKGGHAAEAGDDHGNHIEAGDDSSPTQRDSSGDFRLRRPLIPTPSGTAIDASGHFVMRVHGDRQRFKVEVEAMAQNGTVFMVMADDHLAGTVAIQGGEGELELDTEDGALPEGLDPLKSIKTVTVTDANGNVILQGQV
ncbi:MAG: hypothetical protein U0Q18_04305 [Bryobacteraceae bacterium]